MSSLQDQLQTASWHGEPPDWAWVDGQLHVTTGDRNDFWQGTLYGFYRDDGHFLGRPVGGDFTAQLTFDADYEELYDQAGLMIRRDEKNWVKTGIEYSDGITNFSVVITREGRSDWSVIGVPGLQEPQKIRLTRAGNAVIVHHKGPDAWRLMRLGELPLDPEILVGPMTCSPQRSGLKARFLDLEIGPAIDDPLHAV
jgi:regulation of enolase protein 1 (concanavalin A-like superfamily)